MDENAKKRLGELHARIKSQITGWSPDSRQSPDIAEIQIILAEEQEKASIRMEQQTNQLVEQTKTLIRFVESTEILTRRLVRLTWGLILISVALFVFAVWQTQLLIEEKAANKTESHEQATPHNDLNPKSR